MPATKRTAISARRMWAVQSIGAHRMWAVQSIVPQRMWAVQRLCMHQFTIAEILCLIVVTIGAVIDFRTMKIPNWLTFSAAGVGIALNFVDGRGVEGAIDSGLGWLAGAAVTVIFSLLPIGSGKTKEKLGMGDAKLMAAVGAFLGWKAAFMVFYYFCLSFGVISSIILLRTLPWNAFIYLWVATFHGAKSAPPIDTARFNEAKKKPLPAAFAIVIGTALTMIFYHQTLQFFGVEPGM
jgi:Flp pilus assembly protein protease CpaA